VYKYKMPATRPNNLGNPLRKLRLLLGDGGKPLGQEQFAARAGLSVATVRGIEVGSRPLKGVLDQIAVALKAQWWPSPVAQWKVVGTTTPYEARYADPTYFDAGDPFVDDSCVHMIVERVLDIFGAADREQRAALLIYLPRLLKELTQNFKIKLDLGTTEPEWVQTFDPEVCGKKIPKAVVITPWYKDASGNRQFDPHIDEGGILDFRARRTFNPADYPHQGTGCTKKVDQKERTITAPKTKTVPTKHEKEQKEPSVTT
jgi:hypothetical protein